MSGIEDQMADTDPVGVGFERLNLVTGLKTSNKLVVGKYSAVGFGWVLPQAVAAPQV